jgi:photosystem II stability/assembly factor-like uncharacterized protein
MKKILLLIVGFLFSAVLAGILNNKPSVIKHKTEGPSTGEDIGDYYKWEYKRLADPATGRIPENVRALELAYAATLPNDANPFNSHASSAVWQERGPWNVGGRTRSFAADVNNESILLAGTCSGGMWRSTDSGKKWTLTTPLAVEQGVCCLSQDVRPTHSNIWFYGSGEAYGASASGTGAYFDGSGVYRSKDDGQTWTLLPKTSPSLSGNGYWAAMWDVASDPSAPDSMSNVYAAALGTIYRSADTGNTWTAVLGHNPNAYSYFTDVKVSKKGVVYATLSGSGYNTVGWVDSVGQQMGIWRSTNGINYTKITPPGFPGEYNRVVIGISPLDENQVYFLVNAVNSGMPDTNFQGQVEWNQLWKYKYLSGSGDSSGGEWFNLTPNLPSTGGLFDKFNCQGSYDMVVQFLPTDTSTVFIGGTDIFRSTTGFFDASHSTHIGGYMVGASLPSIKTYPNHHPDQHVIFFSNTNPNIMYSGCDGGVFRTYNDTAANVTWSTLDSGYTTTMFYTVASDHTRPGGNVLIGGAQDNNSLFDNSGLVTNNWTKPIFGDGSFCAIADTGKVFYYSCQEGKMFKAQMDTTTGTLTAFNRIDPIGGKGYQFVNPYVIDPNDNNLMYLAGGKYMWRNNNLAGIPYADQWDSISTNWIQFPDSVDTAGATITAVAISTTPANRLYYGTDQLSIYRIDSANNGALHPKNITSTLVQASGSGVGSNVSCIAVDPNNADNLMVAYSNYGISNLIYSKDGGTTWFRVSGNLISKISLRWAAIQHLPSGDTIYWIAASTGLYATSHLSLSTTTNKTVWVQQGTSTIGNAVCDMVDVRPSDGLVAVATHAHGIFTSNITSLSNIVSVQDISKVAQDGLNVYPNPTLGISHISFNLPDERTVLIKIYDVTGKIIKEYPAAKMSSGTHIVDFNSEGEPAGIYLCTMNAGDISQTIRILVVR